MFLRSDIRAVWSNQKFDNIIKNVSVDMKKK